jgi:ankyrin repeat protein
MELLGSALLFGSNASFFHSPCRGFFTIFLLEKGANNVNVKDYYGSSPLHEACDYGQEAVV